MTSFFTLVRKDLKSYFDQPTGYILLVIFSGIVSFLFFRTVINTQEASLRPLLDTLPWLLAIFVPASTMRLISEEQRDGTLELLITQPLKIWAVIGSKFISGLAFVLTGIALTVFIPIALQTAGDLDEGAIVAQYLGTFFITASFVSIGLFTSALTRNQIVSFILALSIIVLLMICGMPLITLVLPSGLAVLVQDLSPLTHFSAISRGVLDLRDVLYFTALVSTFISATYLIVRGKSVSRRSPLYRNLQLGVFGLVILSIAVGWFGRSIDGRLDFTENNLYTLTPATEELLSTLDDMVTIKLFASKDPPVQVALTTREVEHFLEDLAAASKGKVRVVKRYPDESDEVAEEARFYNVPPVEFNVESDGELRIKLGYLGIGMTYTGHMESIQFVDSTDGLEYRVGANIFRMLQKKPKKLAILYGHGEKRRDEMLQSFRDQLERHHRVAEITNDGLDFNLAPGGFNVEQIDTLVVAGPTEFIETPVLEQIDEFLAIGGKALIMVDPVLVDNSTLYAENNKSTMADYLSQYGIGIGNELVYDVQSNETLVFSGRFGRVNLPYPYWTRSQTTEKQISGGVRYAVMPWASPIELLGYTSEAVDAQVTPILVTSSSAALDSDFSDISPQSEIFAETDESLMRERILAVAITGVRCPPLKPRCEKNPENIFRLIVATDSDWISEKYVSQYPDHLKLGVNWIDWLTQEDYLASIRSKGGSIRPLEFSSKLHTQFAQYGNTVGVPALVVLIGLTRFLLRRNVMRKVYQRER